MHLQEQTLNDPLHESPRKIWLLDMTQGQPTIAGIFLDGEFYLHRMNAVATLLELHEQNALPPMVCVFVSHIDGAARHVDLVCNPTFAGFIVDDLVAWLRRRFPSLQADGHLIAGPSLGGLAASYIALEYPHVFARCLSQSGSHWWNDEALTLAVSSTPTTSTRFWLSVGDRETTGDVSHAPSGLYQKSSQLEVCQRFRDSLIERGFPVHWNIYEGGHEMEPWAKELPHALRWLLND